LLLGAVVGAALAFVAAFLIGRATAPTHEDLRSPAALRDHRTAPKLAVLGGAVALPAPPKRARSKAPAVIRSSFPGSSAGKLIVGTR